MKSLLWQAHRLSRLELPPEREAPRRNQAPKRPAFAAVNLGRFAVLASCLPAPANSKE